MLRKENTDESHVIYVALYIKVSVMILLKKKKNFKFQRFDVAFLILLSVYSVSKFTLCL